MKTAIKGVEGFESLEGLLLGKAEEETDTRDEATTNQTQPLAGETNDMNIRDLILKVLAAMGIETPGYKFTKD